MTMLHSASNLLLFCSSIICVLLLNTANAFNFANSHPKVRLLAATKPFSALFSESSPGDFPRDVRSNSSTRGTGTAEGNSRALLELLAVGTDNPFLKEDSDQIASLAKELKGTYILPLGKPSQWKLLWTNAPDLLGVRGGIVNTLVSITLAMTQDECKFSLLYKPSDQIKGLVGNILEGVADDRLQQNVVFDCQTPSSQLSNQIQLKLKSTQITSTRLPFELPSLPILGGQLLPAAVDIVFNDGDLRLDETVQGGFLFLYQKIYK